MKKLVHNIPFLRITAALSAGILLGSFIESISYLLFVLLIILALILLWLNAHYTYKLSAYFGLATGLLFFITGILLYNLFNVKPQFYRDGKFVATVQEILQEKNNSYQSVLEIQVFIRNDSLMPSGEKVMAYFAKDQRAKALMPGQTIVFNTSPQLIANNNNPFEFNYKTYMERRKIYRQVYLPSNTWMLSAGDTPFCLSVVAEQTRMHLLNIYNQQNWNERQLNVLSALTLGYKRGLDPETKKSLHQLAHFTFLQFRGFTWEYCF